jgi:hypothetical protein
MIKGNRGFVPLLLAFLIPPVAACHPWHRVDSPEAAEAEGWVECGEGLYETRAVEVEYLETYFSPGYWQTEGEYRCTTFEEIHEENVEFHQGLMEESFDSDFEACKASLPDSCIAAGESTFDIDERIELYERACAIEDRFCGWLAVTLERTGRGDAARILELRERMSLGREQYLRALGEPIEDPAQVEQREAEERAQAEMSRLAWESGCAAGMPRDCYELGRYYETVGEVGLTIEFYTKVCGMLADDYLMSYQPSCLAMSEYAERE